MPLNAGGLYLENTAPRMKNKPQCRKKFNSWSLEKQREVYKDTVTRLKHYKDWQAKDSDGKRTYMMAPPVYLNAAMWETPIEVTGRHEQGYVRDTSNETVNKAQELSGLRQMRAQLAKSGAGTTNIDKQIARMENG